MRVSLGIFALLLFPVGQNAPASAGLSAPCTLMDHDQDGDIDLADFARWQTCFTGPIDICETDADCDDPDFCDGVDLCIPEHPNADFHGCVPQGDPCDPLACDEVLDECFVCTVNADCDDGVPCTIDACDAAFGECFRWAHDPRCPDPLFCDGVDVCFPDHPNADVDGCVSLGPPCHPAICNEILDECVGCTSDVDCDDDDPCTTDSCASGLCDFEAVQCPPGYDCNPTNGNCEHIACTSNADCDDGFACTTDSCNVATGACVFTNVDALCPDGQFCTGVDANDVCDPADANAGADGCVRDGDPCGGVTPVCDEANNLCAACVVDADCDDDVPCTDETCEAGGDCTITPNDANCADPDFCDGVDACVPADPDADANGCLPPGDPCDPQPCDEVTDACFDCTGNTDCDDGFLCTDDVCDGASGLCAHLLVDADCPDPDYCDGIDVCNPALPDADANGCNAPGTPCGGATPICDEIAETCAGCVSNAECDDGVDCTDDSCDGGTGACLNADNCATGSCLGGPDPTICD